jgi:predicted regulator of Ras-like GTPase activity (Roadblock/LC7/MglB family)
VAAPAVETLLAQMRRIDGFVLACLVDADSGMVLGAVREDDSMSVPVAAAGAADLVSVLSLMTGRLALRGDLEDLIVTLGSHYHLIRVLPAGPAGQPVLLVTLERPTANLAMAHRELRESASALAGQWFHARPRGDASGA